MRFFGTSTVLEVAQKFIEAPETEGTAPHYVTRLTVTEIDKLPDDRTLDVFMFSLVRVANFSQPHLHFQHLYRVEEEDLETILTGNIDWNRSLFFGVLSSLPSQWRNYLEHSAIVLRTANKRSSFVHGQPADELMLLIESIVLRPLRLASEAWPLFIQFVERTDLSVAILEAVAGDIEMDDRPYFGSWRVSDMLREAPELLDKIRPTWEAASQLQTEESSENNFTWRRKIRKWRPHRW